MGIMMINLKGDVPEGSQKPEFTIEINRLFPKSLERVCQSVRMHIYIIMYMYIYIYDILYI